MPRYRRRRGRRYSGGDWRYNPHSQQNEWAPHRRRRGRRLPWWQYLFSFAVVGGIVAVIVFLVTNYTADPAVGPLPNPGADHSAPCNNASHTHFHDSGVRFHPYFDRGISYS